MKILCCDINESTVLQIIVEYVYILHPQVLLGQIKIFSRLWCVRQFTVTTTQSYHKLLTETSIKNFTGILLS